MLSSQRSLQHLHQGQILSQETTFFDHSQEVIPHWLKFNHEIIAVQSYLQGPLLILVLLLFLPHLQVTSSMEVLKPQKSSRRVEVNFFQTAVSADILTSSHESQMYLMASRIVNPFQKDFSLLCLNPPEESPSMAAVALQMYFLNKKT